MFEAYNDIMTVEEMQEALQISRSAAYKLLARGELKCIRIGKLYRIPKKYLINYVTGDNHE